MAIDKYLNQLITDKKALVNSLVEKGVEATENDTFTNLIPKVDKVEEIYQNQINEVEKQYQEKVEEINEIEEQHQSEMIDIKDRLYTLTTLEKCDIHTSDESVNYEEVNGVMMEYSHCANCYEKCDERSHAHVYGDWRYLNEQNESRVCKCGTTETRVHIYGELTYDPEIDDFVQVCENCGYKKPQHTHSYGTPTKEQKQDGDPEPCSSG